MTTSTSTENPHRRHLLVGTLTHQTESRGIYSLLLDERDSSLSIEHTITRSPNPTFLTLLNPLLFATQEKPRSSGASSYLLNADGSLFHLGSASDDMGAGTCHVTVHPNGRWLYASNCESSGLNCWPIRLDGRLGPLHAAISTPICTPIPKRTRIVSSTFVPDVDLLAVVDQGTDRVVLYHASAENGIDPLPMGIIQVPVGFGPRNITFRPASCSRRTTYPCMIAALTGERANRVILYRIEFDGLNWQPYHTRDFPTRGGIRNRAVHSAFSPDGKRLYTAICGRDVIATIRLDALGVPVDQAYFPSGGKEPCHFSISPNGKHLAVSNKGSDNVTVFHLLEDGAAQEECRISLPSPTCVVWA